MILNLISPFQTVFDASFFEHFAISKNNVTRKHLCYRWPAIIFKYRRHFANWSRRVSYDGYLFQTWNNPCLNYSSLHPSHNEHSRILPLVQFTFCLFKIWSSWISPIVNIEIEENHQFMRLNDNFRIHFLNGRQRPVLWTFYYFYDGYLPRRGHWNSFDSNAALQVIRVKWWW